MAAVSCGIVDGECRLDLEYLEDSAAQADANFVLTASGGIIEVQVSAEDTPFSQDEMTELTRLASSRHQNYLRVSRERQWNNCAGFYIILSFFFVLLLELAALKA